MNSLSNRHFKPTAAVCLFSVFIIISLRAVHWMKVFYLSKVSLHWALGPPGKGLREEKQHHDRRSCWWRYGHGGVRSQSSLGAVRDQWRTEAGQGFLCWGWNIYILWTIGPISKDRPLGPTPEGDDMWTKYDGSVSRNHRWKARTNFTG